MLDRLMDVKEVAATLCIGKTTVWSFVKAGRIPTPYKFGCSTLWKASEIQGVIDSLERAQTRTAA